MFQLKLNWLVMALKPINAGDEIVLRGVLPGICPGTHFTSLEMGPMATSVFEPGLFAKVTPFWLEATCTDHVNVTVLPVCGLEPAAGDENTGGR